MKYFRHLLQLAVLTSGVPTLAYAHPGHGSQDELLHGFEHFFWLFVVPLMIMVGIGLWKSFVVRSKVK